MNYKNKLAKVILFSLLVISSGINFSQTNKKIKNKSFFNIVIVEERAAKTKDIDGRKVD